MSNVKVGDKVRLTDPINKGKIVVVREMLNDGYAILDNLDGTFDCITNCFEVVWKTANENFMKRLCNTTKKRLQGLWQTLQMHISEYARIL